MNDTKQREAFEAWASKNGELPQAIRRFNGGYIHMQTEDHWEIWQAAQSAERKACIGLLKRHEISVGNSRAGEIAAELTRNSLTDLCEKMEARGK